MLNDIIFVSMKPHVALSRYSEVEEEFRRRVGRQLERDVRNRIDPGITFRGHQRAQSVKVRLTDTGKLTIKTNEPGKEVAKPDRSGQPGRAVLDREDTIDDLFRQSSGVPTIIETPGGVRRVAFRTIRDTELFNRAQEQQDADMRRIVDNAVHMSAVDAMDEAVRETERRYPSDAVNSEELPETGR